MEERRVFFFSYVTLLVFSAVFEHSALFLHTRILHDDWCYPRTSFGGLKAIFPDGKTQISSVLLYHCIRHVGARTPRLVGHGLRSQPSAITQMPMPLLTTIICVYVATSFPTQDLLRKKPVRCVTKESPSHIEPLAAMAVLSGVTSSAENSLSQTSAI